GFPGAIVAHAWFDTDNAEEVIAAQAAFPLVRGIRSKPVTAPSTDHMAPGAPGTMQDERWLRGFALLEKYGLSWDLRVPFWHLEEGRDHCREIEAAAPQIVSSALDRQETRRRRNERDGGTQFYDRAERVGGALNEQCWDAQPRKMLRPQAVRLSWRVQRIGEE